MGDVERLRYRLTFDEELLATSPADPELYERYIASSAPDAMSMAEEIEAHGAAEVAERGKTVFPVDEDGRPFLWDYQVKGFFKDACSMLRRAKGTKSSKLTAHKKVIDGMVFVKPRKIALAGEDGRPLDGSCIGDCQRPLRASTAIGERIAIACSQTVPAGTCCEIEVWLLDAGLKGPLEEWLAYGALRGIGSWRNSGKGVFTCEALG